MVEAHLRAAIRAGLTEAEFWRLTPYNLSLRLQELGRGRVEAGLYAGWFSERFARAKELRGPAHYISEWFQKPDPKGDEALAAAVFDRMAADWGLEVEPAEDAE